MDLSFRKKDFNVRAPCGLFVIKNFLNENKYQLLYKKFPGKEYFINKKKLCCLQMPSIILHMKIL